MHYREIMSGIIHINGKNYDEEGNIIPDKKASPKFIDVVALKKVNPPKPLQKITEQTTKPVSTVHEKKRELIKPPTAGTQRSTTLLRSLVKKPSSPSEAPKTDIHAQIVKHKSYDREISAHQKHHQVQRLAKVPSGASLISKETNQNTASFVPRKKTEEMIQAQLEAATAHLVSFKRPKITHRVRSHLKTVSPARRRLTLGSAGAFTLVLVAGTLIYANLANISISIASKKAGFGALLPSYTPNGYHIKTPIGFTSGKIIISFKSNTNDMNYSIEQKPTGWNSDTLREQVTASNGNQYQTQYVNGLTVYFTNDSSATWVDRGILFTLQGNSGLSSEQIASIAASM